MAAVCWSTRATAASLSAIEFRDGKHSQIRSGRQDSRTEREDLTRKWAGTDQHYRFRSSFLHNRVIEVYFRLCELVPTIFLSAGVRLCCVSATGARFIRLRCPLCCSVAMEPPSLSALALPADAWIAIARHSLSSSDRNSIVRLCLVSQDLSSYLLGNAHLWKDIVYSYFFRLLERSNVAATGSDFSAANWRRLFRGLLSCRIKADNISVPENVSARGPLCWLPAGLAGSPEEMAETPQRKFPWGRHEISPELMAQLRLQPSSYDAPERLLFCGKQLYKFGLNLNTADFWFAHEKAADGTPLAIKIGDLLNSPVQSSTIDSPIDNKELLFAFASRVPYELQEGFAIVPTTSVCCCLTSIVPEYVPSSVAGQVFPTFFHRSDDDERGPTPAAGIGVYKASSSHSPLPFVEYSANEVFHLLLPLQDPERPGAFNEERVQFYMDQMRSGGFPTIAGFTRVWEKYRFGSVDHNRVRKQQIIITVIADGHHKLEAASRLKFPVGLLMFAASQEREVLSYLPNPVPSWPLNEYVVFFSSPRFCGSLFCPLQARAQHSACQRRSPCLVLRQSGRPCARRPLPRSGGPLAPTLELRRS